MKRYRFVLLIGFLFLLGVTSYFYFTNINEVLFYLKGFDKELVYEDSALSSKAYHEIAPLKRYFYFIQLTQCVMLFLYSKMIFKEKVKLV